MPTSFYETDRAVCEYLFFHYAEAEHFLLDGVGPKEALEFPERCAELSNRHPVKRSRALDLGCAVGRSALELSASFDEVVAIDFSHALIAAAQRVAQEGSVEIEIAEEGDIVTQLVIKAPDTARPERVRFQQGGATELEPALGSFDFVLMANLIDRLPRPRACLETMAEFVASDGILAITSPYTWLEQYTPRSEWLGGYYRDGEAIRTLNTLEQILAPHFKLLETSDEPFLIREHRRKNQYSIAQASLWRRINA